MTPITGLTRRGVVVASPSLVERPPLARDLYVRRIEREITQGELASRVGCSQPEISEYEHGRKTPRPDRLRRLLEALS